jgi:hypothetical protein
MPIVRERFRTLPPHSANSNDLGQQTLDGEEVLERGVEVWRSVQPARPIPGACDYFPCMWADRFADVVRHGHP